MGIEERDLGLLVLLRTGPQACSELIEGMFRARGRSCGACCAAEFNGACRRRALLPARTAGQIVRRASRAAGPTPAHCPSPNMKWSVSAKRCSSAGLAGALEHLDRLLGRRHRIVRGMQQQERPRRDLADHVVGAEVVHALRGLGGELLDRVLRQMAAQMLRDRHDVVARHHQRLAGLLAVPRPSASMSVNFFQASGARVLAAELALAVAPAAVGDHRRDALVDAAGIDRDRGAEARADHADAVAVDRRCLARNVSALRVSSTCSRQISCRARPRSRRSRHVEAQA